MMRALLFVALMASALPAPAQTPLSPEEFDAHTSGHTLTFSADGTPYGIEQYFEGRRVRWSFLDGDCRDGRWYAEGPAICFVYEDGIGPQCWLFFRDGDGLSARVIGDDDGPVLYETRTVDEPLVCMGPEVGV